MRAREHLEVHLSDETLILLLSDELQPAALAQADKHLANCWQCRARHDRLEHATQKVVAYGKHMAGLGADESPGSSDPLVAKLERACCEAADRPWWFRLGLRPRRTEIRQTAPALAGVAAVLSAVAIAVFLWQHAIPTVSASTFLERAVDAEARPSNRETSGVAYQRIRVRTRQGTFERVVYRDVSGRRQLRRKRLSKPDLEFQTKLALAGVSWDWPLSPPNFKNWHDAQSNVKDSVERRKDGLLTLTTNVGDGIVNWQSLTVRESTFHPVERTVEFKDVGPVEFEELNYDVLGWDSINADLFDPLPAVPSADSITRVVPSAPVRLPAAELDEVELRARLALNEANADFSERLQLDRTLTGVRVTGIVGTAARRHEIAARLQREAHVSVSIRTFGEAQSRPSNSGEITSIQSGSLAAQTPALVSYLVRHGRSPEESARICHELFDSALTAQQEVSMILQLTRRFQRNNLTEAGVAVFDELLARHRRALGVALREEEKVLVGTGFVLPSSSTPRSEDFGPDAARQAERDLILCQELTAGRDDKSTDVEHAIPEILRGLAVLQRLADEPQRAIRTVEANQQSPEQ